MEQVNVKKGDASLETTDNAAMANRTAPYAQSSILILPLLFIPVSSAQTRPTPTAVVQQYCNFDFEKGRISSANVSKLPPLVTWEEEPGWDTVTVVSGFEILSSKQTSEHAVVTVRWEVLGHWQWDTATSEQKSEIVDYQLSLLNGLWKIEAPILPPHVALSPLRTFVLSQSSDDPKRKELWVRNLDSLRPSTTFHWLNSSKDATLFGRIRAAFTDELKPDDPEKVKPVVAQEYKWISRVGVFETSALVLIGERETRTSTYGNYFVAFNYDLKSGGKTALTPGFVEWKFKKLVRFDSSKAPDIVFTHRSCTECEADYLLSSFRLDSTDTNWKVRTWSEKSTEILIGSDYSVGTEGDSKYDCLYKFADFNGDGFDDLAVRCLAVAEQGKILDDTTTIYSIQHGQSQVLKVKDPQQLATLWGQICVDAKKSKLCPSK